MTNSVLGTIFTRLYPNYTRFQRLFSATSSLCLTRQNLQIKEQAYLHNLKHFSEARLTEEGRKLHAGIIVTGIHSSTTFTQNQILNFYVKCGSIDDARRAFDKIVSRNLHSWNIMIAGYCKFGNMKEARQLFDDMPQRDSVSWSTLISGNARQGLNQEAMRVYCEMRSCGIGPQAFSLTTAVICCLNSNSVLLGLQVHADIIKFGFCFDNILMSSVFEMYVRFDKRSDARKVFDISISEPCVFAWNSAISGFKKSGQLDVARKLFNEMPQRDLISWNSMITLYSQHGLGEESLQMFAEMWRTGFLPNHISFCCALNACAALQSIDRGRILHCVSIRMGLQYHLFVGSALVDMYSKCGALQKATKVFERLPNRNVVSWNSMISGCRWSGRDSMALIMFADMLQEGIRPDQFTFSCLVSACAALHDGQTGTQIHALVFKCGFDSHTVVANALLSMHAKCSRMEDAELVFHAMSEKDEVSWISIISGHAAWGNIEDAYNLFQAMPICNVTSWNSVMVVFSESGCHGYTLTIFTEMLRSGALPDHISFASVLKVFAGGFVGMNQGLQVHSLAIKCGLETQVAVANSLVSFYSKCCRMDNALSLFGKIPDRDLVSWNSMITGYTHLGNSREALSMYHQMLQDGIKPDHITFVAVLSACSHGGLVEEGNYYFNSMLQDHGLQAEPEHYACMVDLLGRAGLLDTAYELICSMPCQAKASASVWGALLGACRIHGNVELAKYAAEHLFSLNPQDSGTYILLSNIYSDAGRWKEAAETRKLMKEMGVKKTPGISWIEVYNKVYSFVAENDQRPL